MVGLVFHPVLHTDTAREAYAYIAIGCAAYAGFSNIYRYIKRRFSRKRAELVVHWLPNSNELRICNLSGTADAAAIMLLYRTIGNQCQDYSEIYYRIPDVSAGHAYILPVSSDVDPRRTEVFLIYTDGLGLSATSPSQLAALKESALAIHNYEIN